MIADEQHLDGNALAGVLSEVFSVDMTAAMGTCGHCGSRGALGAALVYMSGPGTVMRCPECDGVLMRIVRIRGSLNVEAGGVTRLELPPG